MSAASPLILRGGDRYRRKSRSGSAALGDLSKLTGGRLPITADYDDKATGHQGCGGELVGLKDDDGTPSAVPGSRLASIEHLRKKKDSIHRGRCAHQF